MTNNGSLIVVGTGIKAAGDVTVAAKAHIKHADIVFMAMPDAISKQWIRNINNNVVDLTDLYVENKSRLDTYQDMSLLIINAVKKGLKVCAAFYGHPGVFVFPSHEAITKLKKLGYKAEMTPGISAEDCLFADLGIDPGKTGCLSIEATQFLFYDRPFDYYSLVILWQIGLIGDHTLKLSKTNNYHKGLNALVIKLKEYYSSDHEVIIYEATTVSIFPPRIEYFKINSLHKAKLTAASTLIIPPEQSAKFNNNMLGCLEISKNEIKKSLKFD